MDIITGHTTVKLGDHFRAAWTPRRKYTAVVLTLVVAAITLSNTHPRFATSFDIAFEVIAVLGTVLIIVGLWVAAMFVSLAIFAARLRKDQRDVIYEFSESGLVLRDSSGSALSLPWSGIKSARETGKAFFLNFKPAGSRYFPKRAFAPDALVALRALLSSKLGRAAKLKTP